MEEQVNIFYRIPHLYRSVFICDAMHSRRMRSVRKFIKVTQGKNQSFFRNLSQIPTGLLNTSEAVQMKTVIRSIIGIIAGLIVGSIVNMGLVVISGDVIPPPEGVDVTSMESLKSSMHLFEPKHFIMPFSAHALGTFIGALVAAIVASTRKMEMALIIGVFFLAGGIANIYMLPSPLWFTILDLGVAYIPMAWLGGKLARRLMN